MKKKTFLVLTALLTAFLLVAPSALATSIVGEWKGSASVSGVPFPLSVTIKFYDNGTFSLSTFGLSASGSYSTDGQSISVKISKLSGTFAGLLKSPSDIGTMKLPATITDSSISISTSGQGMDAKVSLTKQ